jgi:hypothetical protein
MTTDPKVAAQIEAHLRGKAPRLRETVQALHVFVKDAVPGVTESINPWGMPTFESNGPMCYFSAATKHITFGFLRGTSLDDPKGLLEGTGKNLRHVKLRSVDDLKRDGLRELVRAAARLNRAEPMQGMMPKGKK